VGRDADSNGDMPPPLTEAHRSPRQLRNLTHDHWADAICHGHSGKLLHDHLATAQIHLNRLVLILAASSERPAKNPMFVNVGPTQTANPLLITFGNVRRRLITHWDPLADDIHLTKLRDLKLEGLRKRD
jgi:hypothetical protein